MIHDAHCHFFSRRFFETLGLEKYGAEETASVERVTTDLGWETPGSSEELADRWVTELDRHQVGRVALIASVPGDEAAVAAAVARHPSRFAGFFFLNPTAPDAVGRARAAFADLQLRCVCLFPSLHRYAFDDERVTHVFDVAAEHGGAVFAHCGYLSIGARNKLGLRTPIDVRLGDPLALAAVAMRFPQVPVIIPHFGGGFFREALMAAASCTTIHFDTSSSNSWTKYIPGLTLREVFRSALAVVGPERLLFGSDSSFFPRGWHRAIYDTQRMILAELVAEDDAQKVLAGNFSRLFA